uniref:Fizzy related protein n=1 Tax=Paramecium tetraurelia TaxID=5888 RepID=Q7Z101_PARTE|nr:fizzy related protein [Paramecium tetraurelia]
MMDTRVNRIQLCRNKSAINQIRKCIKVSCKIYVKHKFYFCLQMSQLKLQHCSSSCAQSSQCKIQTMMHGKQPDPISAQQQENLINLGNSDQKRRNSCAGDRFIPMIKKKFNILSETKAPAQDIASSQAALEMLYKQQILDQEPVMEPENGSLKFVNQNNFQYKNEHLHYIDSIDPKNYNSPLVDHKYFALPETMSSYYGKYIRKIPKVPFKVLDAPQLQDDFYLNLIDWSNQNTLSVALSNCVYLWNAQSSKVTKLLDLSNDIVTSVGWSLRGPFLGVGTNNGEVQIWDACKLQKVRTYKSHVARVGTLCFAENMLSSGSRDKSILQRDLRQKEDYFFKQTAHKQEVCGLKWSPDSQLLASGGNDNKLYIWSAAQHDKPIFKFTEHQAAVKAIAWSPHQHGLLASGGGTADKTIRFWNALEGKLLSKEDTGSQVCNLMFSKMENELISTHGYSQHQIILWKCNGMKRIATLVGHTSRVLYLAMSPDGYTIVTGAGDETLRFWNIYPQSLGESQNNKCQLVPQNISIR